MLVSVGLLLAWAMPPLTATIVWGWMFDTQYGVVNYVLTNWFGLDFEGHSWLIEPLSFFFVAAIIIVWGAVPFVAFTVYAGLTQVPDEVLEAAQLDGAGGFKRFRLRRLPVPALDLRRSCTILQVIWDLRVFTQIYALQAIGGISPSRPTRSASTSTRSRSARGDFGRAARSRHHRDHARRPSRSTTSVRPSRRRAVTTAASDQPPTARHRRPRARPAAARHRRVGSILSAIAASSSSSSRCSPSTGW